MIFWIEWIVTGSMPVNGSSRRMIRGLVTRQRAISRRRFSPPESDPARDLRMCWIENCSSNCSQRSRRSFRPIPTSSMIARRFCSVESLRKTLCSWAR